MKSSNIQMDINKMPDYVNHRFCQSVLDLVNNIKSTPEGREALERKKAEIRSRKAVAV